MRWGIKSEGPTMTDVEPDPCDTPSATNVREPAGKVSCSDASKWYVTVPTVPVVTALVTSSVGRKVSSCTPELGALMAGAAMVTATGVGVGFVGVVCLPEHASTVMATAAAKARPIGLTIFHILRIPPGQAVDIGHSANCRAPRGAPAGGAPEYNADRGQETAVNLSAAFCLVNQLTACWDRSPGGTGCD